MLGIESFIVIEEGFLPGSLQQQAFFFFFFYLFILLDVELLYDV